MIKHRRQGEGGGLVVVPTPRHRSQGLPMHYNIHLNYVFILGQEAALEMKKRKRSYGKTRRPGNNAPRSSATVLAVTMIIIFLIVHV